jgi:hypothetical protein
MSEDHVEDYLKEYVEEEFKNNPWMISDYQKEQLLEIIQHPEIKELIKSGEWAKMPSIHRRWLMQELYPLPKKAIERLSEIAQSESLRKEIMQKDWRDEFNKKK